MASWHSVSLKILSNVSGWTAFSAWSVSFYPQIILNLRRKSVVGLNFDFVVLNLTKHSSYLVYNASLFFSSAVQRQYRQKYGFNEMIPVAANDVAFSTHAVLVTAFTLFQIAIYDRGNQKVSKTCITIVSVVWLAAAVCVFLALPRHSWFWLVSCFNTLQVVMTVIKYIPQSNCINLGLGLSCCEASEFRTFLFPNPKKVTLVFGSIAIISIMITFAFMNFQRKSTVGFSIGNILLDLLGGVANYGQMVVQSIDQNSWVNFYGNIGKTLLSLVSIFFDLLFILQHYVLYPAKKATASPNLDTVAGEQPRDLEDG